MGNAEDYYREIAKKSHKNLRMLDVVPNNPDDFRSRVYGAHLRNHNDGLPRQDGDPSINAGSTAHMFVSLAQQKISCPECGAAPGMPCRSIARDRNKEVMEKSVHNKRHRMAKLMFSRKS